MADTLNTWTDISCPSGCDSSLQFAAIPTDQDCILPPKLSQVSDVYWQPTGAEAPFSYSGDTVTAPSGAIDNSATDNSKSKWLVGKGGVAEPEVSTYDGPKGKTAVTKRRYRLEFEVNVREKAMYDMVRYFQCNPTNFNCWYADRGDFLYGGENGITPVFSDGLLPKGNGDDDNQFGTIIIEYETDNGDPPRHTNPLAT